EAIDPPLADPGQLGDTQRERVEGEAEDLAVEVAAAQHRAVLGKDQRVVGHRAQLALEHAAREADRLPGRAVHLRHAAPAVGLLYARAVTVRLDDAAAGGQPAQVGRDGALAGVRPQRVDARVERRV